MKKIQQLISDRNFAISIILFLTILVFSNSLFNNIVLDDDALLNKWTTIQSLTNIPKLIEGDLPQSLLGSYRPLRSIFYAVFYSLWGENPFFYHLSGVIMHFFIVVVVYLIIDFIFKNKTSSFIGGLLFALHPLHTESIDWIAASMDLIGIFFFFLSFYFFLLSTVNMSKYRIFYSISLISAFFAFFGNERTLILPLIVFAYICIKVNFDLKKIKALFINVLPFVVLGVFYFFVRSFIFKISLGAQDFVLFNSFYYTILFMVKVVGKYLLLLIFPFNLSINHIIYPGFEAFSTTSNLPGIFYKQSLFDLEEIISLFLISFFILSGFLLFKRNKNFTFGVLWIFLALIPDIFFHATLLSERYIYVASFGFILMLVSLFRELPKKWVNIGFYLLILLSLTYGILSFQRNKDWYNPYTIWTSVTKVYPKSALAYYNLGRYFSDKGEYKKSINYYKKVISIRPDSIATMYDLAVSFEKTGEKDNAIKTYEEILAKKPDFLPALEKLNAASTNKFINYSGDSYSFSYPSFLDLKENKEGIILSDKNIPFSIILSEKKLPEGVSVNEYINNQKTSYGTLVNQGLAQIPLVDYAYAKIWTLSNSNQMIQFFLFSSNKVLEIRVSPSNSPLMKTFDQIVSSLNLKLN